MGDFHVGVAAGESDGDAVGEALEDIDVRVFGVVAGDCLGDIVTDDFLGCRGGNACVLTPPGEVASPSAVALSMAPDGEGSQPLLLLLILFAADS